MPGQQVQTCPCSDHARGGNVLWGRALLVGAIGIVGSFIGGYFNRTVPPRLLLAGFVVVMVLAAIATWRRATRTPDQADTPEGSKVPLVSIPVPAGSRLAHRVPMTMGRSCPAFDAGPFLLAAVGVGILTGFFGVGGGFLEPPRAHGRGVPILGYLRN